MLEPPTHSTMYILRNLLLLTSVVCIYYVSCEELLPTNTSTHKKVINPVLFKNVSVEVPLVKNYTGRERDVVKLVPATNVVINATVKSNVSTNGTIEKPETIKPIKEKTNITDTLPIPPAEHHGKIVPKKGVSLDSEMPVITPNITISNSSLVDKINNSAKVNVPKKPLLTESDDDNNLNLTDSKEHENFLTVDQIDPVMANKKSNRSDYVVLIVAVIMSVPLIAFLMSVIYKRSQDWWQHRYYKRMDFLIEGMYHN